MTCMAIQSGSLIKSQRYEDAALIRVSLTQQWQLRLMGSVVLGAILMEKQDIPEYKFRKTIVTPILQFSLILPHVTPSLSR